MDFDVASRTVYGLKDITARMGMIMVSYAQSGEPEPATWPAAATTIGRGANSTRK